MFSGTRSFISCSHVEMPPPAPGKVHAGDHQPAISSVTSTTGALGGSCFHLILCAWH